MLDTVNAVLYNVIVEFHDGASMVVSFIGHRKIENHDLLKDIVFEILKSLNTNGKLTFFCGGYGDFDELCASAVKDLKAVRNNVRSVLVTPYIGISYASKLKAIADSDLYDEILYPALENVPYKFAISARNKYMVDSSDLIISYVINTWGGAYSSLKYAERKLKKIIYLPLFFPE